MRTYIQRSSYRIFCAVYTALTLCTASAHANEIGDRPGGKDHALVSRYQGSALLNYGGASYEEVEIPLGAYQSAGNDYKPGKSEIAKGKLSNYFYWGPKGRSELEILRNYETALTQHGFKLLYACDNPAKCAKERLITLANTWSQKSGAFVEHDSRSYMENSSSFPPLFLSAKLVRAEGDVYVALTVLGADSSTQRNGYGARYFLQVVESAPAQTDRVKVDAAAIRKGLLTEGKMAIYGIEFDTNKAIIKPESKTMLSEMAKALTAENPNRIRVYIVGHTDNQGTYDNNLALSRKRAEAVVAALRNEYGIAADRLLAAGVADLAPTATNATESGRAKNRRVEMVVR